MATISPDALADRLQSDDAPRPVDVRPEDEFEDWHVPGSVNVDVYDALREAPEEAKAALRELPRDRELVTVCGVGVASRRATELLRELGYDATTLEDGLLGWSRVHLTAEVPIDGPGTLVQVARPGTGCLSYVLHAAGEAIVVDPSQYAEEYTAVLDAADAELAGVYDTHAHADHLSGGRALAAAHDVPYHRHPADALDVEATPIEDGETIDVGPLAVEVLHTPGHSPGGVTYAVDDAALLTGDTLFHDSVGRVELGAAVGLADDDPAENAARLYESLQRLLARDGDPWILPAHHPGSPDPPVIARRSEVRERNPDLGAERASFVDRLAADRPEHPPNVRRIKRANVGLESIDDGDRESIELGPNRCAAD